MIRFSDFSKKGFKFIKGIHRMFFNKGPSFSSDNSLSRRFLVAIQISIRKRDTDSPISLISNRHSNVQP